ncbi:hypothetical protein D9M69_724940 [compost metagenome]
MQLSAGPIGRPIEHQRAHVGVSLGQTLHKGGQTTLLAHGPDEFVGIDESQPVHLMAVFTHQHPVGRQLSPGADRAGKVVTGQEAAGSQ